MNTSNRWIAVLFTGTSLICFGQSGGGGGETPECTHNIDFGQSNTYFGPSCTPTLACIGPTKWYRKDANDRCVATSGTAAWKNCSEVADVVNPRFYTEYVGGTCNSNSECTNGTGGVVKQYTKLTASATLCGSID